LIDITKLPPPEFGPIGLSGWQNYLARPDVLAILQTEYLSQLSRAQLAARKFAGGIDMSTGREWPDWTTPEWVDFHTYKELQRAANQAQWAREQAQLGAARPTPSPQPEAARQVEAVLTDPDIMTRWSPSKEDLESMERVLKLAKANEPVAPVTVPDLPWLPPGPAKVLALLRRAADPQGRVSISQNTIVTETGLDRRYVQRLLDRLVESTLLEVVRPGFGIKKNGQYRGVPGQYQLARTPDYLKAKEVLIRPPGRKKK
jgi:hypothetical protein